ncbi:hypothetical protein M422DRAFT_50634 [Sphaerobolus stellatus SS14]|uniref:F-box domain-containing protein n=1 Tax=Sphaerobolus stellatus (strain SS14) TaxID=990650 RepID=A0A0C9V6I3_SPHS4|nr:hypothetical protein M422DRAFT_50634 [Sphaerobolus stellatus SS14]
MSFLQTSEVLSIDETFPTEVMQLIFSFAIPRIAPDAFHRIQNCSNGLLSGDPYPDEVREVILNTSKRWRIMFNATPQAWSTIVPIPGHRCARRNLERCLDNSAGELLDVYFPPGVHLVQGWFDTQVFISLLRPHTARFSRFYTHFNPFQEEILLLQSLFLQENIQHFHLRELGLSSGDRMMVMTAARVNFPSLTHLALSDDLMEVFRQLDVGNLRNLTSLRLIFAWRNTEMQDLRLLGFCSRLETLDIEVQALASYHQNANGIINLESLKYLKMSVPDPEVAGMLFASVSMPRLTHLVVSFVSKAERYTSINGILGEGHDHLTHLSIHNTSLQNISLASLPNLTALRLFHCRLGPASLSRTLDLGSLWKIRLHACQIFVEDVVDLILMRQKLGLVTRVMTLDQQGVGLEGLVNEAFGHGDVVYSVRDELG